MTFSNLILLLYGQLFVDVSIDWCKGTMYAAGWLMLIKPVLAEIIFCLRTWAIWKRNKAVGMTLLVPLLITFAAACYVMADFLHSLRIDNSPYPGFQGCFWISAKKIMWAEYTLLFGIEAIVLAFVIISAVRLYRAGVINKLSLVTHMDGIIFYIYLLIITGANLVISLAAAPNLTSLIFPLEDVLYATFATRVLLNIRSVGNSEEETELHTSPRIMSLRFASHRDQTISSTGTIVSRCWYILCRLIYRRRNEQWPRRTAS